MAKRTLFAILSEHPWWVTLLVALALFGAAYQFVPQYAFFVALPFFVVAAWIAWKQMGSVSPAEAVERLKAAREMTWEKFREAVIEGYRRQGYTVEQVRGGAFDLRLTRGVRTTLVQCRRWKVNQVGVEAVRELFEAAQQQDAYDCVCISTGEFSAAALQYAAGKRIALVNGTALAALVGKVHKADLPWYRR
jgi:restriction system protein